MDDLRHRIKLVEPAELPRRLLETGMVPKNSGKLPTVLLELHSSVRDNTKQLKNYGVLPWWTPDDLRASNWRPLDSFTHWLDYRLYPNSALMIHIHNILWFAALISLVTILYRRLMVPAWTGGLAAILYLLDESNYLPTAWIANRNLLLSVVFGILALLAHHRKCTNRSLAANIFAPICLILSLLSTEAGIAIVAYLFAYAIFLDKRKWTSRILSLAPYILIVILWRVVYSALGHGAYGSDFVIDPVREPFRFAVKVLERAPFLLMAQWSCLPAEIASFLPTSEKINAWLVSGGFLLLLIIIFKPLLVKNRVAKFWFTAMLLSVLPICATLPMNRNLLFVAIGAFALIAQFAKGLRTKEIWLPESRLWHALAQVMCITLLFIHIILSGTGRIFQPRVIQAVQNQLKSTMQIGPLIGSENQDIVVVNAPSPFNSFYIPPFRAHYNESIPQAIRVLSPGFAPIEIIRINERALQVRTKYVNLLSCGKRPGSPLIHFYEHLNGSFRNRSLPLNPGEKIVLPRLTVEIIDVDEKGMPTTVLFEFTVSLDHSTIRWLQFNWENGTYCPFRVPEIGQTCEIAGPCPRTVPNQWMKYVSSLFCPEGDV